MCLHHDEDTFWLVFGELTNNTGDDRESIEVVVTFFDSSGSEIAEDYNWVLVEIMPDGSTLPFATEIVSLNPPAQYSFNILADVAEITPRQDLQVSDLRLEFIDGDPVLTGRVWNPGADLTDYAEVIATFYNQDGAVVALGYEFLDIDDLGSLQTTTFGAIALGLNESVFSYSAVAYGY